MNCFLFFFYKTCQFHLTDFILNEFSFHSVKSKQLRCFLFTGPIHIKTFCHLYAAVTDADLFPGRFPQTFPLLLFDVETESLRIESVMILWMVLHYRMFCEGIKVDELTDDFKKFDMKSHFRKIVGRKWDVYSTALSENISYFSPAKKRSSLTFDSNWFAKELTYKNTSN